MDFFQQQDNARRRTRWLLLYFILLVFVVSLCYWFILGMIPFVSSFCHIYFFSGDNMAGTLSRTGGPVLHALMAATVISAVVFLFSFFNYISCRRGGGAGIAESVGGQLLNREILTTLSEKQLLNVVEEMALAAGMAVPPVYLLREEQGLNAFAAGNTPDEAVIGITQGALDHFTRKELQGVIGHEFSHILNGDMRLNMRLVAMAGALSGLSQLGTACLPGTNSSRAKFRTLSKPGPTVFFIYLLLMLVGVGGNFASMLLKAAVSRQREFLADAGAVQFTRDSDTIGGALKRLLAQSSGTFMRSEKAREMGFMMFGAAGREKFKLFSAALADHPPLEQRILAIDPAWDGTLDAWLFEKRKQTGPVSSAISGADTSVRKQTVLAAAVGIATSTALRDGADTDRKMDPKVGRLLKQGIPQELLSLAGESCTARLLPLLLIFEESEKSRTLLRNYLPQEMFRLLKKWLEYDIPEAQRLPLFDLAMPALRSMSPRQSEEYLTLAGRLVDADGRIELREWVFLSLLRKRLAPDIRIMKLMNGRDAVSCLLSTLAIAGQVQEKNAGGIAESFAAGVQAMGIQGVKLLPRMPEYSTLERALYTLARLKPATKKRLLQGCRQVIVADRQITVREAELFRTFGSLLDAPMAPFSILPNAVRPAP
ncbi:M48 family metalloprotease [Desulforhopalus vacuolatus]|uniref:M48 family metalloprotease n=1 Tax=Desulforhopalus vacuolatus TaxID=40414 RepID=UPI001964E462|nr:M48 family metalloprotease [Desulforhopalus vacuolatus]MBM9518307.1 M48 family metalloprotease [Desulforhopalus vacuolatus]